jgi:hypothetical protein
MFNVAHSSKRLSAAGLLCPGSLSLTWSSFVQAWTEVDGFSLDLTSGLDTSWIDIPLTDLENNDYIFPGLNMAFLPKQPLRILSGLS